MHHSQARGQWTFSVLMLLLLLIALLVTLLASGTASAEAEVRKAATLNQTCQALGTVGFHDYGGAPTSFHPTVFNESTFQLEENVLLSQHLAPTTGQRSLTFLTLVQGQDRVEFECKPVRLSRRAEGLSCINQPPTTLLLLNQRKQRYTRSNLAAWTFSSEQTAADAALATDHSGESMFIEHGTCSTN